MEKISSTRGELQVPETWTAGIEECLLADGTPILVERRQEVIENEREITSWVEYWAGEELIHRSVHVELKPIAAGSNIGAF